MGSLVLSCFDHELLIHTKVLPSLVNSWILDTGWEMCYSFNVENYAILSGKPILISIIMPTCHTKHVGSSTDVLLVVVACLTE